MAEEVKFTEDEMKKIKEFQESYVTIQQNLGQLSIAKLRLNNYILKKIIVAPIFKKETSTKEVGGGLFKKKKIKIHYKFKGYNYIYHEPSRPDLYKINQRLLKKIVPLDTNTYKDSDNPNFLAIPKDSKFEDYKVKTDKVPPHPPFKLLK